MLNRAICVICPTSMYRANDKKDGVPVMTECQYIEPGKVGKPAETLTPGSTERYVGQLTCPVGDFCPGHNVRLDCGTSPAVRCPAGSAEPVAVRGGYTVNR